VIKNFCPERGCILFDLDGTLLDSAPDILLAGNQLFSAYNKPALSLETMRPIAGEGTIKFIELGMGYTPKDEEFEKLRQTLIDNYQKINHENSTLFPGIPEILQDLNDRNLPWGIVTNKPKFLSLPLLDKFPILKSANVLVYADTLAKAKPHPDPILYACQQVARETNHSIYIGDHERDILAGKAAGLYVIAALYGYIIDPLQAKNWPADDFIHSVEALKKLLQTL